VSATPAALHPHPKVCQAQAAAAPLTTDPCSCPSSADGTAAARAQLSSLPPGASDFTLLDFQPGLPDVPRWLALDDDVMGGVSSSSMNWSAEEQAALFLGGTRPSEICGGADLRPGVLPLPKTASRHKACGRTAHGRERHGMASMWPCDCSLSCSACDQHGYMMDWWAAEAGAEVAPAMCALQAR
jgi:hypothetical protein